MQFFTDCCNFNDIRNNVTKVFSSQNVKIMELYKRRNEKDKIQNIKSLNKAKIV